MDILSLAIAVALGIKLAPHLGMIGRGILWLVVVSLAMAGWCFLMARYDNSRFMAWRVKQIMEKSYSRSS